MKYSYIMVGKMKSCVRLVCRKEDKKKQRGRLDLVNKAIYFVPMKAKHAITLLVLGYCLDFIGALIKILHRPEADATLTAAAVLKVLGALFFLYKLTNYPKFKDFFEQ